MAMGEKRLLGQQCGPNMRGSWRPFEMWWLTRRKQISSSGETDCEFGEGGNQFRRLLETEVCASAVVMQDAPYFEVV